MTQPYLVDLPPYGRPVEAQRPGPGLGDLLSWNFQDAYSSLANAGFLFLAGVVVGAYLFSGKKR